MMSLPSPPRATSSPPLPSMRSLPCRTPEGVVVVAADDAVDTGSAVVDRLAVDAGRVDGVACPVGDGAVGMADEQEALVAVGRRRVVGDEEAVEVELGCRPCEVGQLELAVGRRECVGLQRVGAVGVALDQLGERVALELGAQVQARGAGQVVEPVAVLQLLELRLEHVVERAAQEAAEEVGDLGEAADPQVDLVEARVGDAVGVACPRPGRG